MSRSLDPPDSYLSKGHKRLSALIRNLGFLVADEYEVGYYRLDCYLSEFHLCIEWDGHWGHKARAKKDKNRDDILLEKYGIPVLRLSSYVGISVKIADFIDKYSNTLKERKTLYEQAMEGASG